MTMMNGIEMEYRVCNVESERREHVFPVRIHGKVKTCRIVPTNGDILILQQFPLPKKLMNRRQGQEEREMLSAMRVMENGDAVNVRWREGKYSLVVIADVVDAGRLLPIREND